MAWKRYYKGWCITYDGAGRLACYRMEGECLEWCYFGVTVPEVKAEIDYREFIRKLDDLLEV